MKPTHRFQVLTRKFHVKPSFFGPSFTISVKNKKSGFHLKPGQILKPCTCMENGIKINLEFSDRLQTWKTVDKLVKFLKKLKAKNMSSQ